MCWCCVGAVVCCVSVLVLWCVVLVLLWCVPKKDQSMWFNGKGKNGIEFQKGLKASTASFHYKLNLF